MEIRTFHVEYLAQFVNSYLIQTDHYNVFIDTSLKHNEEEYVPYLSDNRENIVLLTHGHWDHIGCNSLMKKNGARIYANKADLPWLTDFQLHWDIGFGQFLDDVTIPPARWDVFWSEIGETTEMDGFIQDGDELTFDDTVIRVIALPGHSAGSIGFYLPADNVMFTGDALMETGFFGGLAQYYDAGAYRSSMQKLIQLNPKTVYTAHTPEYFDHKAAEAAETAIRFSHSIEKDVLEFVHSTDEDIRIGDAARYVCGKEGKKVGGGACITVLNHLAHNTDPDVVGRLHLEKYHCGI